MRRRHLGCIAALATFSLSAGVAAGKCQLQQLGVLPVDMQGLRPIVSAKINGVQARFVLDSGAFYTTISRDAAAHYQLPVTAAPGRGLYVTGVGGRERAQIATAESFDFLGVPLPKVGFVVVEHDWGDMVGFLGQNLLRISDVEYDLANGTVRFIRPVGCSRQPLAYWAVSTPYSAVDLKHMDVAQPHLLSTAMINGHRVTVMFDTGDTNSLLTLQGAERAGITTSSPGVSPAGMTSGFGPASVRVWVAPVATFQIGGEKVQNAHLLIGDVGPDHPLGHVGDSPTELILGEDFFLSHRIYVAYSQGKLYFTYNGGPLFNLNLPQTASAPTKPAATPATTSQARVAADGQSASNAPTDADGFRRQGMAYASMREFDRALSDLTHACNLAPQDAENHYDRGMVYFQDKQPKAALNDLGAAITLQPDYVDAHLARAHVLLSQSDTDPTANAPDIKSDLDAVGRLEPTDAGVRLMLADLYGKLGDYPAAIEQADQWLSHHPLKNDQVAGLNERCWLRVAANRDLPAALDDCNQALNVRGLTSLPNGDLISTPLAANDPRVLNTRGLLYLRLGDLKDAIRDYDAALRVNANTPNPLYGRGLAELRLGEKTQGESDLAAAAKLDTGVAGRFAKMGLTP